MPQQEYRVGETLWFYCWTCKTPGAASGAGIASTIDASCAQCGGDLIPHYYAPARVKVPGETDITATLTFDAED